MYYYELKENKIHGTKDFPFIDYHVKDITGPFQIPVHWHDEFEIIFSLSGSFVLLIDSVEYKVNPGEVYIINPGEIHLMGSRNPGADYHSIVFPFELIAFRSDDKLSAKYFTPLIEGRYRFLNKVYDDLVTDKMIDTLNEIIETYEGTTFTRELKIRILLLSFIEQISCARMVNLNTNPKQKKGRSILSYIQQNYTEPITLAELARLFHMSEKYLSRYFKQTYHITLSQYIGHLRITKAKSLLLSTNLPITDVAMQSGFQDVSYFVRTFHKTVGTSPLKYRNQQT